MNAKLFILSSITSGEHSCSPDGQTLATSGMDGRITLWDVVSGQNVATIEYPWLTKLASMVAGANHIRSVTFSPDGKMLASGNRDNDARLWDVASRQELATLRGHKRAVRRVAFSPDGKTLASASYDGTIRLWDVASRHLLALLKGHEAVVMRSRFRLMARRSLPAAQTRRSNCGR